MKPLRWLALAAALVSATAFAQQKIPLRFSTAGPPQDFLARSIQQFKADLEAVGQVEQMPKMEGRQMIMIIGPAKKKI